MIQFIELVPVEVENENWEQEQEEFLNSREFGAVPPQKKFIRFENNAIDVLFPWSEFENTKQITINDINYSVECIGPKEYTTQYSSLINYTPVKFIQKIYIRELP